MNTYRVIFRNSTVVDDFLVDAKSIVKAAKKAKAITRDPKSDFFDWTVYSITLV